MEKLLSLNKLCFALFAILCIANNASSQINLVSNASFEIITSCPTGAGEIDTALNWSTPKNGGGGNPEVYNTCATVDVGIPINNVTGFQYANSGIGYAGIDVAQSTGTAREYIQSKLLGTLQGGKIYCVSFYTNLANYCSGYIQTLGAYLDSGNVYSPTMFGLISVSPQVYNTGPQLNDTINWMKIQGSFVASGIESYITIGNFFDNASSNIGTFGSPSGWASYYYIDDVSVIDVSTLAHAGNDTLIHTGDSVFVGRPPETGLNEDCIWSIGGIPMDTIAGMWVYPTIPTTYVLQQTICGNITYDSIHVNIVGAGINELENNINLQLFPNPNDGNMIIHYFLKQGDLGLLNIYDITGKLMEERSLESNKDQLQINSDLQNGIYFYQVLVNKKIVKSDKLIIIQ